MNNRDITNRVKKHRLLKRWTQKKLEDVSEVTGRTISKIESDPTYEPTGLIKSKIAKALGEEIETVFPAATPLGSEINPNLSNWLEQLLKKPFSPAGICHEEYYVEAQLQINGDSISSRSLMEERFKGNCHPYSVILGQSGSGKTWLSLDMAKLAQENEIQCIWVPVQYLISQDNLIDSLKSFTQRSYPELINTILIPNGKHRVLWIFDGIEYLASCYQTEKELKQCISDFLRFVGAYNLFENRCFVLFTCNQLFRSLFEGTLSKDDIFEMPPISSSIPKPGPQNEWSSLWHLLSKGRSTSLDSFLKDDLVFSLTTTPLLCSLYAQKINESNLDPNELLPDHDLIKYMVKSMHDRHWNPDFSQVCDGEFEEYLAMLSDIAYESWHHGQASFCLNDLHTFFNSGSQSLSSAYSDLKLKFIFSHFTITNFRDQKGVERFQFDNEVLFQWLIAINRFRKGEFANDDLHSKNKKLPTFANSFLHFLIEKHGKSPSSF